MERLHTYKCELCGNIVEVMHAGGGPLNCCGQPMKLLSENTTEAATEKHIPVTEKTAEGLMVKVGSVEHPMTEDHYIQWIEVITADQVYAKFFTAGEKPEALFKIEGDMVSVRAYCNLHGLWKA